MTNLERVAYIRGLAEGLELDTDKKEVKVLDAMLTLLEDMALSISDLEEAYEDMADQLDAVDEDYALWKMTFTKKINAVKTAKMTMMSFITR